MNNLQVNDNGYVKKQINLLFFIIFLYTLVRKCVCSITAIMPGFQPDDVGSIPIRRSIFFMQFFAFSTSVEHRKNGLKPVYIALKLHIILTGDYIELI